MPRNKGVPDLSPEGLKELTQAYKQNVDQEAIRLILEASLDDIDPDWIRTALTAWRESAKISKAGTARLLGMSRIAYLRIENGQYPINKHFLGSLQSLLKNLESGFPFHPSDRKSSSPKFRDPDRDYIPTSKLKNKVYNKHCANPNCKRDTWFFTAYPAQRYCSDYCADYVAQHKHIEGVMTRTHMQEKDRRRVVARCPHCHNEFQVKGTIINGQPGYRRNQKSKLDRHHKSETDGQADHDGKREEPKEV